MPSSHRSLQAIGTAVIASALLLVVGGCSGADEPSTEATVGPTTTSESPSAAATTATTPTDEPTTDAPVVTAAAFDLRMVQQIEVNKQNKGGQANVQVIAGSTSRQDTLDIARGCVDHYLQEQKAAFCHVWSTQANFDARDPSGVGADLVCWTFYVGVPLAGGDPVVTETKPYMFQTAGCPDPIP